MTIETIVNQPVPSNSYIISEGGHCVVIDPGSKDANRYMAYIEVNRLILDYIILTHDHFDHTWSADLLRKEFKASIVCSSNCGERLSVPQNYFNRLYFNDETLFSIVDIERIVYNLDSIDWQNHKITFYCTPGHSLSSICIQLDDVLFSGDTIIKGVAPFVKKRHDGSIVELRDSIIFLFGCLNSNTLVYSGHGEPFLLFEVKEYFSSYFGIHL